MTAARADLAPYVASKLAFAALARLDPETMDEARRIAALQLSAKQSVTRHPSTRAKRIAGRCEHLAFSTRGEPVEATVSAALLAIEALVEDANVEFSEAAIDAANEVARTIRSAGFDVDHPEAIKAAEAVIDYLNSQRVISIKEMIAE